MTVSRLVVLRRLESLRGWRIGWVAEPQSVSNIICTSMRERYVHYFQPFWQFCKLSQGFQTLRMRE